MTAAADWLYARRAVVANLAGFAVAALSLALPSLFRIERRPPDIELLTFLEETRDSPGATPARAEPQVARPRAQTEPGPMMPRPAASVPKPAAAPRQTPPPARASEPEARPDDTSAVAASNTWQAQGRADLGEALNAPRRAGDPSVAAEAGAPEPAAARRSNIQSGYERQVLAALERAKRYPGSREARLTRPQGAARIWVEISRDGRTLDAGLAQSSGSNLLDSQATSTARSVAFPPFPEGAFNGAASHRFTATLKYELSSD